MKPPVAIRFWFSTDCVVATVCADTASTFASIAEPWAAFALVEELAAWDSNIPAATWEARASLAAPWATVLADTAKFFAAIAETSALLAVVDELAAFVSEIAAAALEELA